MTYFTLVLSWPFSILALPTLFSNFRDNRLRFVRTNPLPPIQFRKKVAVTAADSRENFASKPKKLEVDATIRLCRDSFRRQKRDHQVATAS